MHLRRTDCSDASSAAAFLGFAVKVPLIPFHTWLPSAYAEAPTGTTMLLTGVMSKMGVYGLLRILLPIFYVADAIGSDAAACGWLLPRLFSPPLLRWRRRI